MPIFFGTGAPISSSQYLLSGETNGWAMDGTIVGGSVTVKDTANPLNNLDSVPFANSNMIQGGTSAKMVYWDSAPYLRWSAHNMFLNSEAPATQSVTLVVDRDYTFGITGPGNLVGTAGAAGTATDGHPATFTATTTTGTFTLTGSPYLMQLNRGSILVPYLKTTGGQRVSIPQSYHPATGKFSVRAEAQQTNMRIRSMEFDNISWTKTGVTIAPNTVVAPDGTMTADFAIASVSSTEKKLSAGTMVTGVIGTAYIVSVFVKAAGYNYAGVGVYDGTSTWFASFNLRTGVYDNTAASSGVLLAKGITYVGGGWYRIYVTFTAANTSLDVQIKFADTAFNSNQFTNWTGDGISGVYFWGVQLEAHPGTTGGPFTDGSEPSSFIPTYSTTVTRGNDGVHLSLSTIPWIQTDFSLYVDFWRSIQSDNGNVWEIATPIANDINREGMAYTIGTQDNGTFGPSFNLNAFALRRSQVTWARHTPNDWAKNEDGQATSNTATGSGTANTTMSDLGWYYHVNGGGCNAYYYRMVVVPRRVSNVDMTNWRYNSY